MIGVTKVIFGHFFPDSKMGMYMAYLCLYKIAPDQITGPVTEMHWELKMFKKLSSKIAPHLKPAGGQANLDFAAIRTDLTSAYT